MKGFQELVDLRRSGVRPATVGVSLVPCHDQWPALSIWGSLAVEILPSDPLGGIDFRPLVGLPVVVDDWTNSPDRLRKVALLVSQVETEQLAMVVRNEDGSAAIHIRRNGETKTHHV